MPFDSPHDATLAFAVQGEMRFFVIPYCTSQSTHPSSNGVQSCRSVGRPLMSSFKIRLILHDTWQLSTLFLSAKGWWIVWKQVVSDVKEKWQKPCDFTRVHEILQGRCWRSYKTGHLAMTTRLELREQKWARHGKVRRCSTDSTVFRDDPGAVEALHFIQFSRGATVLAWQLLLSAGNAFDAKRCKKSFQTSTVKVCKSGAHNCHWFNFLAQFNMVRPLWMAGVIV